MKKLITLLLAMVVFCSAFVSQAAERVAYDTYSYSYEGEPIKSPHAYTPKSVFSVDSLGLEKMKEPQDLFIDDQSHIYVADTGNNRVLVFDKDKNLLANIAEFTLGEETYTLAKPSSVFVTTDGQIYVCDGDNKRIVEFNPDYTCRRIVKEPNPNLLPPGFVYTPSKIAMDKAGRIYVVSVGNVYGVVALNYDGEFETFIGAQKVTPNLAEQFWRLFKSDAQKERTTKTVPTNYNNLAIDKDGFIYVTAVHPDSYSVTATIVSRSKDNRYASVKKLNPNGEDVLRRTGFFPPAGDVKIQSAPRGSVSGEVNYGPSFIGDVAIGQYGVYSLMDMKRNKIFTYDGDGNLLYAFGGTGYQPGLFQQISSIAYDGDTLYALDSANGKLTEFEITEYGKLIASAIELTDRRKYDAAVDVWKEILLENNTFDLAHIGLGNAMMRQGNYEAAMQYYKNANDLTNYSKAYSQYRKEAFGPYVLLIALVLVLVIFGISKFFGFAKNYNTKTASHEGKRTIRQEIMYAFYIIFHPFDGFWDLKREKRGGVRGASIILAITVACLIFNQLGMGYILAGNSKADFNALVFIATILGIVLLWCVANWCLTCLMNGKGTFKDIYVASCYSLLPMAMMLIPATIISNFVTQQETMFVQFFSAVGFIWTAFLLFASVMVTHDYTPGKNVLTVICILVGMVLIAFVLLLFVNLLGRIVTFAVNIYNEIAFRM